MNLSAFDFETSGELPEYALQPWRLSSGKFWATSLAVVHKTDDKLEKSGGLNPTRDMMADMMEVAIKRDQFLTGWNTVFDISVLLAYGLEELVMKTKWLDGMLLWRHYFLEPEYDMDRSKKKPYKLQECIAEHLPEMAGYKDDVDFHNPDPEVRKELHRINMNDTLAALILTEKWYGLLTDVQCAAARVEAQTLPLIAATNFRGLLVDTVATHDLRAKLIKDAKVALSSFDPSDGMTAEVIASPTKLAKVMFDQWGLRPLKHNTGAKTGKVSRSTDKETLHELAFVDKRASLVQDFREAQGNRKKFAENILASVAYNEDGSTHPLAIPFGTYSGRLTYSSKQGRNKDERQIGFAIHQEKNDGEYRRVVIAPPNHTLVEFDAKGQEYRWMAVASGDEVMMQLCQPGEDAHSFMGASIEHLDYHEFLRLVEAEDKASKPIRKMGKVANLCLAEGTLVLTDRGVCCIEQVELSDRVWDGVEFVRHDGVVCSGVKPVISYAGVTATPKHEVLVGDEWCAIEEAALHGRAIQPAMGKGWARKYRSTVRIVDGLVRRAFSEMWRTVCTSALQLRDRARRELEVLGDGTISPVQGVRCQSATPERGSFARDQRSRSSLAETGQRLVPTMQQPQQPVVSELWCARDRVPVPVGEGRRGVGQGAPTTPDVPEARRRSRRQRWSLRSWKLALGYAQGEPSQQTTARVYDITNCGPRSRFAANGVIVHNSLQYRTRPPRLRTVARVQYDIPMELPQAEHIHRVYLRTYRGIPPYWATQIAQTKKCSYVETLAGRRVQVVGDWGGSFGWKMGSTAINYRIQGTGADQKYLALAVLKGYIVPRRIRFVWDLHDGLYFYIPNAILERSCVEMQYLLDNLPYKKAWGFTPPIPLPWDCKVGHSWGALKEFHPA